LQGGGLFESRREGSCEVGGFLQGGLNRRADFIAQRIADGGGLERLAQRTAGLYSADIPRIFTWRCW